MASKLIAKRFIKGRIRLLTGLHIGGPKTALDIGGIDLNVIKTAAGNIPYIPGSSLKGKLRTLLAREVGSITVSEKQLDKDNRGKKLSDEAYPHIVDIFGYPGDSDVTDHLPTRLLVRDAYLCNDPDDPRGFDNYFEEAELSDDYTEEKWENTINRRSGTAEHPRQLERVPAGAEFSFELVYNVYEDESLEVHMTHLRKALLLLEDDYLGGQGSRGYGQIEFVDVSLFEKTIKDYENNAQATEIQADFLNKLLTSA